MTKKVLLGAIVMGVLIASIASFNQTPSEVTAQLNEQQCPAGEVQHWNKIVFWILRDRNNPQVIPQEDIRSKMDIVNMTKPNTLLNAQKAAHDAIANEYGLTQSQSDNVRIRVTDIEYQVVVCEEGPLGPAFLRLYNASTDFVGNVQHEHITALCDSGDVATGGGFKMLNDMQIERNTAFIASPGDQPTGWQVKLLPIPWDNSFNIVQVQAICADLTP